MSTNEQLTLVIRGSPTHSRRVLWDSASDTVWSRPNGITILARSQFRLGHRAGGVRYVGSSKSQTSNPAAFLRVTAGSKAEAWNAQSLKRD